MTHRFINTLAAGALALALPLPAAADDLLIWGEAGGWDVLVDPTLADGCLIQAAYDDGSLVRIGLDRVAFTQAFI